MLLFITLLLFSEFIFTLNTSVDFLARIRRNAPKTIMDYPECNNIRNICHDLMDNDDLLILECLLSSNPEELNRLPKECQNTIWNHITNILKDQNVKSYLLPTCGKELDRFDTSDCKQEGNYFKCVLNNVNDIQNPQCSLAISRLGGVAFTDYRWIKDFLDKCSDDIDKLKCGMLDGQSFSQTKIIACLQSKILEVKDSCKKEVFHLSELQSINIKLDSQLYIDCADDHHRYCSNFKTGSGRVFSCLLRQLNEDHLKISTKCRQHLQRRERLIAQDFKVSKGLLKLCKEDIKNTHCRKQTSSDKTIRLAQILLCLEDYMRNGTRINSDCVMEITEHRKMLMEDYRLSPEIMSNCKNETALFCNGIGSRTIHCLMNQAMKKRDRNPPSNEGALGDRCLRALEDLVKQTDVGENWSIDPVLQQACDPVVKMSCRHINDGDSRIMSCLMDNLRSDRMTEECENALLEIQYFVARDFKLDPLLYRACKQDAVRYCHMGDSTENEQGPSYSREILPCLYRHAYQSDESLQIQKHCLQQIQRVMRQRAVSVDLQPEIEESCLKDLGFYCRDKVEKGEEMQCLQDNLEELEDKCHDVVASYTEIEAQHVELNPLISKYCSVIIDSLCSNEADVMDCLVENKNQAQVKARPACRASIEHFQLISLKDYKFNYKFKLACKSHAMRLCSKASTKSEVIACLSEHILNATVQGVKPSVPKDCKQQLKAQLFQQREKIEYDPVLKAACGMDIKKFCKDVQPGNAQILECLQTIPNHQLTNKCGKEIFKAQKMEIYDNSVDYALITKCADTIDLFCPHTEKEDVFECLKLFKDKPGFSEKCRTIVTHRLIEQNSNNLLNPTLQEKCRFDITKFCKKQMLSPNVKQVDDAVIKCLKNQFKMSRLSESCETEMADILRQRALDINLNPLIRVLCKNELETICKLKGEQDSGKVEECLKNALISKNIPTAECRVEVANMIEESQADIQVDPLLQRVCAQDLLTLCKNIEQGNGRHINCLKIILEKSPQELSLECKSKLKERLEMYRNAAQVVALPEGLRDIYQQVSLSPSKNYLVIISFTLIGSIFLTGVFCGRFSNKKYRLLKNK